MKPNQFEDFPKGVASVDFLPNVDNYQLAFNEDLRYGSRYTKPLWKERMFKR
jgi:hypothetical protein